MGRSTRHGGGAARGRSSQVLLAKEATVRRYSNEATGTRHVNMARVRDARTVCVLRVYGASDANS
eukprot:5576661-Prymnesium_polylepis.1